MATVEDLTRQLAVYEVKIQGELKEIKDRLTKIEDGGGRSSKKSLLHSKMITPKELVNPDGWKKWKADIEDYCEEVFGGMKDILENTKKSEEHIDENWFSASEEDWWSKAEQLWRLQRRFTEGEARRVSRASGTTTAMRHGADSINNTYPVL